MKGSFMQITEGSNARIEVRARAPEEPLVIAITAPIELSEELWAGVKKTVDELIEKERT